MANTRTPAAAAVPAPDPPVLAGRLGASVRALRRDIDWLRELGYSVEAQRGVDGGYQLAAGAALPPLGDRRRGGGRPRSLTGNSPLVIRG